MSDLTPEEQTQPPRVRRAARPKAKAYSARRTNRPAASFSKPTSTAEPTPTQEEAAATGIESKTFSKAAASQPEPELVADDRMTFKVRNLTLVSRRILIWGGIAGGANFLFFLITLFTYNTFGGTSAQATQNAGLLNGVACLSFIVPPALAFFAGLRATVRAGNGWYAAAAGIWSLLFFEVLGLIYTVIALAVTNQLQTLDGPSLANFAVNFVFEALIAFGAGYFGGWFSERRRRQARQRQEMLTSSS